MFSRLTERLSKAVEALRGRGRLTEDNIAETLREVRMALLEADVALPVVRRFIDAVRAKAIGTEVQGSLTPGQALVGVIHDELVALMGGRPQPFELRHSPPAVILLAGLQGAGKTTTAGKLARLLIGQKKRVLLASTDIRRPAAVLQLERLAKQVGADFHPVQPGQTPVQIAASALEAARRGVYGVLVIDTAGRLHVDAELMQEVRDIDAAVQPHERLFVVDAMAGQDAVNAAKAFGEALALTGTILTKADGDARGGAALSVREITGTPLLFIGTGEKTEALEPFDPDRMARRILGMGDVVALVEEVRRSVDEEQAVELAKKVARGKGFDFNDLKSQLEQLAKMGGVASLLDKLPGGAQAAQKLAQGQGDQEIRRQIALINSMTPRERRRPEIIDGSRRRRIAAGAGLKVQDINRLLKQHMEMQKMMKKLGGGKLQRMLGAMAGKFPGMPRGF
ncbi:MAG: signal recognition particle protein [Pseudomonadota bacterium]|jgi:signal recognition particle subunit SRP54